MKPGVASRIATAIRTQNIEGPTLINLIGLAVAYAAPTPKSAADSVSDFWVRNLSTRVNEIISELGEHLVFNTPMTLAVAKEAYRSRVKAYWSPVTATVSLTTEWDSQTIQAYTQAYNQMCAEFGIVAEPAGTEE